MDNRIFNLTNSTFINNHGFRGAALNLESVVDDENLNYEVEMANFSVIDCRMLTTQAMLVSSESLKQEGR
jgi:hypothetical protein